MKTLPLTLLVLPLLAGCSLHQRLDNISSALDAQYHSLDVWEELPVRTITWNQAVDMMTRNNLDILRLDQRIASAEREEISVYTDLIPGVSYYGYLTAAIKDLASSESLDDFQQNINVTFNLPSLTRVGYDVYASKASTYAAIKAREGKIRENVSALYLAIRQREVAQRTAALEKETPDRKDEALQQAQAGEADAEYWNKVSSLLGNRDARWEILPSSVPKLRWEDYRDRLETLDPLVATKWALELEKSRLGIYGVALQLMPTINTSLYSPSLFSSTGGTYSGTFLSGEDTRLNLSLSYSLDTKLTQWNRYQDSKAEYERTKKTVSFEMMDRKVKLAKLRRSVDEYFHWRSYMEKRIAFLRSQEANAGTDYIERERTLREMQRELLTQEAASLESEAAIILEYGLPPFTTPPAKSSKTTKTAQASRTAR